MQRQAKPSDHQGGLKKPAAEPAPANDTNPDARMNDASTGGLKKPDQAAVDAKVDEAVKESFPASDPPSFNRGHTGAPCADRDNDIEKP